ncbi:NADP-dependent 3-hydroxy acid dehydrogenase YdfG [Limimonas halophila]|uniref:NADP-dependent 3-hydroxy acid dehydrogenase YdfG n=1 Tax=Limimonas halophila TaxID=1082479 RepID=A0A1G7TYJ6_9PROT|nr:SDR family oxidoreductase [Limimonas halophila]SDG40356.1 NADP-dependent 3-hydroxy acid dehydrogenase YdfG [Limimonas halophila]
MSGALAGSLALVTGASRGIGRAVARRFAAEGATVIAVARHGAALDSLIDEIAADGSPPGVIADIDLTDAISIDALAEWVREHYGRLDVLVGNAATAGEAVEAREQDPSDFDTVLRVNVTANQALIRAFDPLLRASDAGRAIFVTSGLARRPKSHMAAYCASKAALEVLVRAYADDVADSGVRANLLDPGVVNTVLFRSAMPESDTSGMKGPDAVADAFVALARPAETRTGQTLSWKDVVDG